MEKIFIQMMNAMRYKCQLWVFVVVLPVFTVSCSDDREGPLQYPGRTVLFYFAGDNNLSAETLAKTQALCEGWPARTGDAVLVYRDAMGEPGRLYTIKGPAGRGALCEITTYDDRGSATPERVAQVITDMRRSYPGSRYAMVVFSHATGWLPQGSLNAPKSAPQAKTVLQDDGDELDIPSFASALPAGMLDYIVLEACFMAGVEVAWELRDKTPLALASSAEILSPGFTELYRNRMAVVCLLDGDLSGFGRLVSAWYDARPETWQRSATFSLIRTEKLAALRQFIRSIDVVPGVIPSGVQQFGRPGTGYGLFHDFAGYYESFLTSAADKQELTRLISACVPWEYHTAGFLQGYADAGGFEIWQHSGLSLYVPRASWPILNEAHSRLSWSMDEP
jgi:hypothetical protein